MTQTQKGVLISFGLGGHSIDFLPYGMYSSSSLSGYENPETFEQRFAAGDYQKYDLEGATVIDKREALRKDFSLAVTLPMFEARLQPNEVNPFAMENGASFMLESMAKDLSTGMFGALAKLKLENTCFTGLDYVGLAIYTALWRGHKARIGKFCGGRIVWEQE